MSRATPTDTRRVFLRVNLPRFRAHRWYDVDADLAVELVANGFATWTGGHGEAPPDVLPPPACCGER